MKFAIQITINGEAPSGMELEYFEHSLKQHVKDEAVKARIKDLKASRIIEIVQEEITVDEEVIVK